MCARFKSDAVEVDAARVLRTLSTIERQVESSDSDALYVMRMLPYRTIENVIAGVVITFTDLSKNAAADAKIGALTRDLRDRVESLETLINLVPMGIFISEDVEARAPRINRQAALLLGLTPGGKGLSPLAKPLRLLDGGRELPPEELPLRRTIRSGQPLNDIKLSLLRPDGSTRSVILSATPLFDAQGTPRGAIAAMVELTEAEGNSK